MRFLPISVALLGAAGALLAPRAVLAQTLPSIDAQTFHPSTDPRAQLVVEPTGTPGPGEWNVGAWVHYDNHPFTLRRAGTDEVAFRPVEHLLGADLTASLGLGKIAAIGLSLPTAIYQTGTSGMPATVSTTGEVPTTAIGDVGLHGKATIVSNEEKLAGFGLAALGTLTLPTGDRSSLMGAGSATATARMLLEYKYVVARVQASLGYMLRTDHHAWPDASAGGTTFGDEIPWTFGVALKPGILSSKLDEDNRQSWEIGLHGTLPAGPVGPFGSGDPGSARLSAAMLGVSDRVEMGHYHDVYALVGVDFGLSTAVGVPTARVLGALGWAPRSHDKDGDEIPDDRDECPDLAEDHDGKQDQDGCPEDDADEDTIPDDKDVCPTTPGVNWNDPKHDGCPAPDTDGDGIADPTDACPFIKGDVSQDPKRNGCPRLKDWRERDRDHDKIPDRDDACPREKGDAHPDPLRNGCPNHDHDDDGIPDDKDACPSEAGEASTDPLRHGCKNPDRDHDTYADPSDTCPDAAEVFNGVKDDDGCPDDGGKPLVVIDGIEPELAVKLASSLRVIGDGTTAKPFDFDAETLMTLRALAREINQHPTWTIGVGVKPGAGKAEDALAASLARADLVVKKLDALTFRSNAAEVVQWEAVRQQPGSDSGVAFVVLITPPAPTKATTTVPGTPTPTSTAP